MNAYAKGLKSGHWFNNVNRKHPPAVKLAIDTYDKRSQNAINKVVWAQLWHMN